MATFAVGDVQGCVGELRELMAQVRFDQACDRIIFVGDLVNRGPDSLEALRFIRSLGSAAQVVLGNHDLHFLALHYTGQNPRRSDTLAELLQASDVDELAQWLRSQPLVLEDPAWPDWIVSHAGIPPSWSLKQVRKRARLAHKFYAGPQGHEFFEQMYGNEPRLYREGLGEVEKTRCVVNHFTRMRMIAADGGLDLDYKGAIADAPVPLRPWFEVPRRTALGKEVLFGHWAALNGDTNLGQFHALDTGCAWGDRLTALCLETRHRHMVVAGTSLKTNQAMQP